MKGAKGDATEDQDKSVEGLNPRQRLLEPFLAPQKGENEEQSNGAAPEKTALPPGAVGHPLGFDVYHKDGEPDFTKLQANGMKFMFAKALEGTDLVDDKFQDFWTKAGDAGLVRGAYDFSNPEDDGKAQAQVFLNTLKDDFQSNRDFVALDLEGTKWKNVSSADRIGRAIDWLDTVEESLHTTPIVYMSKDFGNDTFGANVKKLEKYPLWLAQYKVPRPTVQEPFAKPTFWQFTETAKFPGLAGSKNDLNVYLGDVPLPNLARTFEQHAFEDLQNKVSRTDS